MGVVTPEGKVKNFIRKYMQQHFPGHWYYSPMGGAFGKGGVPDHLYLWEGILIAIEAKADKGVLSELQKGQLAALNKQKAICAVVRGRDVAKMDLIKQAVLKRYKKLYGKDYEPDRSV